MGFDTTCTSATGLTTSLSTAAAPTLTLEARAGGRNRFGGGRTTKAPVRTRTTTSASPSATFGVKEAREAGRRAAEAAKGVHNRGIEDAVPEFIAEAQNWNASLSSGNQSFIDETTSRLDAFSGQDDHFSETERLQYGQAFSAFDKSTGSQYERGVGPVGRAPPTVHELITDTVLLWMERSKFSKEDGLDLLPLKAGLQPPRSAYSG